MPELWLPGYEHDTAEADQGAGLGVGAGHDKAVLHSTESPRGSYNGVRNLWRGPANWGRGLPHFIQDGPRFVQLLPLTVNAYTLENPPGPPDTNRSGHVIQVERCGYARDGFTDVELDACGRWLADLVRAGIDLDLSQHPRFPPYPQTAPYVPRFTAAQWDAFGGFCGHVHVPQNTHGDPGYLDGDRLEAIARHYLGEDPDMPLTDEDVEKVATAAAAKVIDRMLYEANRFGRDPRDGAIYRVPWFGDAKVHLPSSGAVTDVMSATGHGNDTPADWIAPLLDAFPTELPDTSPEALAKLVADRVGSTSGGFSDADLQAVAKAVNDELARRAAG